MVTVFVIKTSFFLHNFLLNIQISKKFSVSTFANFSRPTRILIGGDQQAAANAKFNGHIVCLQLYATALDDHVISAAQFCPSNHGEEVVCFTDLMIDLPSTLTLPIVNQL